MSWLIPIGLQLAMVAFLVWDSRKAYQHGGPDGAYMLMVQTMAGLAGTAVIWVGYGVYRLTAWLV